MAKKSICLYFQVHQPIRLRLYRFFDMGKDAHYYDDFANRTILKRVAQKCYLPMNETLLKAIKESNGQFKVAFSISGVAIDQFDRYAPEIIDSFRELAKTGCVEFLSETHYHSLSALANPTEFKHQVGRHKASIESHFGVTPTSFRNTELIYSNAVGKLVADLGYHTILTEGARHIMGWRSPNYVYSCEGASKLKVLMRNYNLSDDIAFRFQGNKLTAEGYVEWMKKAVEEGGDVINLFMDYETFGEHTPASTGIFDFMSYLPKAVAADGTFEFATPAEVAKRHKSIGSIDVPETISWADEERDLTAWLGNELQQDAYNKLYAQYEKLSILDDDNLWADFGLLQQSDHFYYMCTKFFSDGEVHKYFNPYDNPYEAFINYMNVLSDFIIRINDAMSTRDNSAAPASKDETPKAAKKIVKVPVRAAVLEAAAKKAEKKTAKKAVKAEKKAEKVEKKAVKKAEKAEKKAVKKTTAKTKTK